MAEYYRSEIRGVNRYEKMSKRSVVMAVIDFLLSLLSLVVGVAMLLTLFSSTVFPSLWLFPILGLVAPATYVLTTLLALYWVMRWKLLRALPLALLLLVGLFMMDLFLRPELKPKYGGSPKGRGVVKLMSYNVRQFYGPDGESSRDSLLSWVRAQSPDIICFQEFNPHIGGGTMQSVDSLLGNQYYYTTGDSLASVVIYTRYRILNSGRTRRDVEGLKSIWADLLVGSDTLRVYNNHLTTTAITSADQDFLSADGFLQDTAREERLRSILSRFCKNSVARAAQADTVAIEMSKSPFKRIVCGDFNDTPLSYTTARMREGLRDAFSEKGRGYSYTFNGFKNVLRIDYALFNPEIELLEYEVLRPNYSDHYPVLVYFRRPDN